MRFGLFPCFIIILYTDVPHRPIATETLFEHPKKHWDFSVHIVVYSHFGLAGIQAMETARVLNQCPFPRHRQGEKQAIQSCVVETFSDVAPCREEKPRLAVGRRGEVCKRLATRRRLHSPMEHDKIRNVRTQLLSQSFQVLAPLREHDRGAPVFKGLDYILTDEII